jgi:NTE family protein
MCEILDRWRPTLRRYFGELQVEELPRPLFTVSADLVSTQTVVHRTGPLVEAVGASMSIPGLAPPRASGRRLLIDGGVLNNLPVDLMQESREGLAIDVVRRRDLDAPSAARSLPPIMETMTRATVLGSAERSERNRALAALVISPDRYGVGLRDFGVLDEAIAIGRAAAEAAPRADGTALWAVLQGPA